MILDYGVEGKEREEDFNIMMNEMICVIEFVLKILGILVVSIKIIGMVRFDFLVVV